MKITSRLLVLFALCTASSLHAADGAALWKKSCAKCHGADGRGDTRQGRKLYISDLSDPAIQAKFTDEQAAKSIKTGLKDAKGRDIMHGFRRLSDDQVTLLVAHVRSLKRADAQSAHP